MVDAVRVSTSERKGLRYMGDYYQSGLSHTEKDCRDECISDLDCRAWAFQILPYGNPGTSIFRQTSPQCLLTNTLKDNEPQVELFPGVGGLVEYKKVPDYGKTLMWLGIMVVFLFAVWYFSTSNKSNSPAYDDGGVTYDVVVEESVIFF